MGSQQYGFSISHESRYMTVWQVSNTSLNPSTTVTLTTMTASRCCISLYSETAHLGRCPTEQDFRRWERRDLVLPCRHRCILLLYSRQDKTAMVSSQYLLLCKCCPIFRCGAFQIALHFSPRTMSVTKRQERPSTKYHTYNFFGCPHFVVMFCFVWLPVLQYTLCCSLFFSTTNSKTTFGNSVSGGKIYHGLFTQSTCIN